MKLWHCADARSFRPLWALEALGLDYALELLPFPPRFLKPEYLQTNPLGTIPFFEDGATHMTESAAIVEYLATRYRGQGAVDLAVDVAGPDYGAWLNWLHYGEATLTFPQTLVLRYTHFEPAERRQPQVAADYARWFLARLRAVDAALQHSDFLCAGRFTAADVAVAYALQLAQHLGLDGQFPRAVADYWLRLQARPAFQSALRAQHRAALEQGVDPTPSPDLRPA